MRLMAIIQTLLFVFFLSQTAYARLPFRNIWTQSFYTDDSSYYLTLFQDGFRQLVRTSKDSCDQINTINVVLKDNTKKALTTFNRLTESEAPKLYGLNAADYCWYQVEARGLPTINGMKYVLRIIDTDNTTIYFKGITSSLLPENRLTQDSRIDSWIELGAFGATPVVGGGVFYKIWEPLSEEVHLFINDNKPIKLFSEFSLNDERRFHYAYVKESSLSDKYHYQFVKNGIYEKLEVANFKTFSAIKVDPMARELSYEAKGGRFNGYINPRGIVSLDNSQYVWKHDKAFLNVSDLDYNNWIIYQLWPLTFNPKQISGAYVQGKFSDVVPKIPYLSSLGVNAVELLPVHESRFNASWGYALDSLIILENSLGTKADLKKLVDELHAQKIRVLFDVVLNHVNNNLLREPISATTNSSKFYSGDTPWGPKPRFESVWVRKWITDSLLHLMNEYHLDGYRFDMTDSIFNGTKGGYRFLQELMTLIKINNPRFYNSAEQLPDDVWVTYPQNENGLGFDSQWNDRFKNFFELEFDYYNEKNRAVDLTHLANSLLGFSDHQMSPGIWYHFGDPYRTVNYLGSHDFIGNKNPLIRIVTGYDKTESEDSNVFSRVNPLEEEGDLRIPFRRIHNDFSHAMTRLAYGILFTKPGAALFYQGEELAQDLNLQNEWSYMNALQDNRFPSKDVNINKYVRSHRMPWHYYELANGRRDPVLNFTTDDDVKLFAGHLRFFKDMIKFKKLNPEINYEDAKNVRIDQQQKTVTYELKTSTDWYFVVVNFNFDNGGAWIQFPGSQYIWWDEIINSSSSRYGSDSDEYHNIISSLGGRKNLLRLKGPGFYIFKAGQSPSLLKKLYFRSSFLNWQASEKTELKVNSRNTDEYHLRLVVPKDQIVEFKLGTDDWTIDLGKSTNASVLTYVPHAPNVKDSLEAGPYTFKFNIRTYTYSFEKLNGKSKREK